MHPNEAVLTRFYTAFAALDPDTMAGCYAPDASFRDEVFTLKGRDEVMGMWRMLCETIRSKGREDWKLVFGDISADAASGQAHWDATYRFSATGRLVVNRIDARVRFAADGRIVQHHDSFSFWRWSRQALGAPGLLLGWSPWMHRQVRARAEAGLRKYLASQR